MKCFRAKLSERRETSGIVTQREANMAAASPRHYCQRRMADATHDEREWIRRFTPERYHLTTQSANEIEGESGATTPQAVSETPEMIEIKTPKNVFRPAFLTVTTLDLPAGLAAAGPGAPAWVRRRAKYRAVPKHCSGHLHRMFVKNGPEEEAGSRPTSRASTEYERFAFEDYIRADSPDSSDISLFLAEPGFADEDESSNNNDSLFMNMNDVAIKRSATPYKPESLKNKREAGKGNLKPAQKKDAANNETQNRITAAPHQGSHKKERRKSITLSRIPSPETVQVIRIDVITGYPVDNESLISEATESDALNSESVSQLSFDMNDDKSEQLKKAELKYQSWKNTFDDINNAKLPEVKESCSLLKCKSLSLSMRN